MGGINLREKLDYLLYQMSCISHLEPYMDHPLQLRYFRMLRYVEFLYLYSLNFFLDLHLVM